MRLLFLTLLAGCAGKWSLTDADGDLVSILDGDCDDDNPAINPDAIDDNCDGIDDNCDGVADEGGGTTPWYTDNDGDGFGDPASALSSCGAGPEGAVADNTDCDDASPEVYPGAAEACDGVDQDCDEIIDNGAADAATWYADTDGDGFGDEASTTVACDQPDGYVEAGTDCDDGDAAFHPGATESDCEDPNDYNCDGSVAYDDADLDGFIACQDCNDASDTVHPGADETCDGVDQDCDSVIDNDAIDGTTFYADGDGDRYGDPNATTQGCEAPDGYVFDDTDCDDSTAFVNPDATELCNTIDDDCDALIDEDDAADGLTWYADTDGDGYGDASATTTACTAPAGYVGDATDCDDGDPAFHPGASESNCDDPTDYNCDGSTAYADADGDGSPACEDCDDSDATALPGGSEVCDGADNDCNGTVDDSASDALTFYADRDTDGYGALLETVAACTAPSGYVADATDCDDTESLANPGEDEACDGFDDDCDGDVDEASAVDALTWYRDADSDTYGAAGVTQPACTQPSGYVANATDCNDTTASANPGHAELCDTIDNNCDGVTDESTATDASTWYRDSDTDGYGSSATHQNACTQPSGYVANLTDCDDTRSADHPGGTEYCDSRDNNCDGTTDEDSAVDATTWYGDDDGDGYGALLSDHAACTMPSGYVANALDCDDSDVNISPAALEYCSTTADDDCDGTANEASAADAHTYYVDADGDNYGATSPTTAACTLPSGYSTLNTDCDDSATGAGNHPYASEYCDSVDNDCDGSVDEAGAVDAGTWYLDGDADGYGGATAVSACSMPVGAYFTTSTDCDDGDSAVHPGADELCNGVDDNCDSSTDPDYFSTTFASDPGTLVMNGSSSTVPSVLSGILYLTTQTTAQRTTVVYNTAIPNDSVYVQFDFTMAHTGSSGSEEGEGLTFFFLNESATSVRGDGAGYLGIGKATSPYTGYAVALDTVDGTTPYGATDVIKLMDVSTWTVLDSVVVGDLNNAVAHRLEIELTAGEVNVWLANTTTATPSLVLTTTIPGYADDDVLVGWSAATPTTGAHPDSHRIDNATIGCP